MDEDIVRVRVKSNGGSVEVQIERKGLIIGVYDSKDDPVPDALLSPAEAGDLVNKLSLILASMQSDKKKKKVMKCDRQSSSTATGQLPTPQADTLTRQKN